MKISDCLKYNRVNKIALMVLVAVILSTILFVLTGCDKINIKDYPAARTSFEYTLDDSIPLAQKSEISFDNASRGFRGETYINLGTQEAFPYSGENYVDRLNSQAELYAEDDIKLMQVYVYLCNYCNTDIPEQAFAQLKEYFEMIRSKGFKMLLRFAYETEGTPEGPRTKDIERHCEQIKGFIYENSELFNQTVYAVQLGMIGLWGEGHGSKHNIDVKRVAAAVAEMVPDSIPLMVRTPEMLTKVPDEYESRYGIHDDFLVGYDHEWGMMSWQDEDYPKLLNKSKYTVTDGEMPWGRANTPIDSVGLVKQCAGYGLTSLSIEHNYKEEGKEYCLQKWKSEYLTKEQLEENALPYNPNTLQDGKISIYDYLKYHLGYQLAASNLKIENGKASFMMTNFGFACPYNYQMNIYVDGKLVTPEEGYSYLDLIQFGQKVYTFDYTGGKIEVEFVNARDGGDKIKFANAIPYENGRNVIFEG